MQLNAVSAFPRWAKRPRETGQSAPFQFSCMFDHSGFRSTQYTLVVIYPGLANPDPLDAAGMTVVKYEQLWQS